METLLRSVAAISISGVVVWACMLDSGAKLAERQYYAGKLSPDSQYMTAVYAQRVGNEPQSIGRALALLSLAGQSQQAEQLRRFFAYCSVRRFFGQDDACTRETVRSAIGPGGGAPGPHFWTTEWPVTAQLASQVNRALSFSLATERLMRQDTESNPGFWISNSYGGPGLILNHGGGIDAFLVISARNRTPWEIKSFRARVELPSGSGAPLVFDCDEAEAKFRSSRPLISGGKMAEGCFLRGVRYDELLRAIREAQRHDSISGRVERLFLGNPYVLVAAASNKPTAPFEVSPAEPSDYEFYGLGSRPSIYDREVTELKRVGCHETGNCQSPYEAASLTFYTFSSQHASIVSAIVGLLLGVSFSALSQRSLLFGSTLMAVPLAAAAAFIGYLIYSLSTGPSGGFGGLAIVGLIGLYVTLLVPSVGGFFVGMALIRLLRGLPEPSP